MGGFVAGGLMILGSIAIACWIPTGTNLCTQNVVTDVVCLVGGLVFIAVGVLNRREL